MKKELKYYNYRIFNKYTYKFFYIINTYFNKLKINNF